MKKKRKKLIIGGIIVVVLAIFTGLLLTIINDENNLTLAERQWVNDNTGVIQNTHIINNVNIFSRAGTGVFYDFIDDFSRTHGLTLNPIIYNIDEPTPPGIAFRVTNQLTNDDLVFFRDHYVLVGQEAGSLISINDLSGRRIGVLEDSRGYIAHFLNDDVELMPFEDEEGLMAAFAGEDEESEIDYILVPRTQYMNQILENRYYILLHLSDIVIYYTLRLDRDEELHFSNVLNKFYNTWINTRFGRSYDRANREMFLEALEITQRDKDTLTSRIYSHGFMENSPFEVIRGGIYGGIISTYIRKFADFADMEFRFVRYRNMNSFNNAINNNEIDLYFSIGPRDNHFRTINTLLNINFNVIARRANPIAINTVKALEGQRVYVLENSFLEMALRAMNVDVRTYSRTRDIRRIRDNNALIAIDSNVFEHYRMRELTGFTIRYTHTLNQTYHFRTGANDTFALLFSSYINSLDPTEMINRGLYNHHVVGQRGNFVTTLSIYALVIIGLLLIGGIIFYRRMKKVNLGTKIKKEDKLRFIDQLTSLKNRNYLAENIDNWNKNTVYPQAMVVMDLNNIQEINDTLGYDQGDAQIKAAANILINTQLDNSDIIRTDGNEFLVYLVGYNEKRVADYIRRVYKELKNIPFDYGAVIGHSMVIDNLKTAEDAINEAIDDMKAKKLEAEVEEI